MGFNFKGREDQSFIALGSLMWHFRKHFLLTDFLRIFASVCVAFHPYFFAQLATSIGDKDKTFTYLLLLFASGALHWFAWHGADYINARFINPLFYEFKKIAFAVFWDKSYETFIEKPSGKVGHYINEFKTQIYSLYDAYHYGLLPMAASIPIYIFLLYRAAWQGSAVYAVFLVVTGFTLTFLTKYLTERQRLLTDEYSSNSGRVFDSYANFVNVFSFRTQHKEIARNNSDMSTVINKEIKAAYSMTNYWTVAAFMIRLVLWPIILFYSWYLYDNNKITFASLIVSVTVLLDFTNQYWNIVHQLGAWTRYKSTYREAYNYLFPGQNIVKDFYQKPTLDYPARAVTLTDCLEIKNLGFAYPDAPDQTVLQNINIKVAKNEKIGIVGKSGSGKSTLIKILLGFYKPTEGKILVDGLAVDSNDLSQLYAYVPQDTTLFQESIFYNIAYAKQGGASLEEVKSAAKKAHISSFIERLPNGYNTLVGERGVKLSLGQRQRIAIARAFLKESDLLILDEATSSLDSRTESYVQESFEKLWGDKSVIAIAHRLSTLNNVDRIIVMNEGRIVEQGTKAELLALNGHFADLWSQQKKGMI